MGSVYDTTLACAQLELSCWLARREPIKSMTFYPDQTKTWLPRTYRTSVPTVDIGKISLVIPTQYGAEITICGIGMFLCIRYH